MAKLRLCHGERGSIWKRDVESGYWGKLAISTIVGKCFTTHEMMLKEDKRF